MQKPLSIFFSKISSFSELLYLFFSYLAPHFFWTLLQREQPPPVLRRASHSLNSTKSDPGLNSWLGVKRIREEHAAPLNTHDSWEKADSWSWHMNTWQLTACHPWSVCCCMINLLDMVYRLSRNFGHSRLCWGLGPGFESDIFEGWYRVTVNTVYSSAKSLPQTQHKST